MPQRALLFVGVLFASLEKKEEAKERLMEAFGDIFGSSPTFPFHYTDYYAPEMGPSLQREFWSFAELRGQEDLLTIKKQTMVFEERLKKAGKRTVNLDPGLLTLAKVILASRKDFSHRLYLGEGVFGEVTLMLQKGNWQPLPWTYPDYREPPILSWFLEQRRGYRELLKESQRGGR